jgi:ketosteroid isomerase-like protein
MSAAKNIETVKACYEAFGRGDIAGILGHVADKINVWGVLSATDAGVPWHLAIREKAEIPRFFEALGGAVEFTRFEPAAYAASDTDVYATIQMEMKVRKNGKRIVMQDVMHHFTFKDGKVVGWRAAEDTALTSAALR